MSTEIVSDHRLGIPVAPSQAVGLHMHTIALKSYRMPRQGGRRSGRDGMVHVSSRGDYVPPGGIRIGRDHAETTAGPHTAARNGCSVFGLQRTSSFRSLHAAEQSSGPPLQMTINPAVLDMSSARCTRTARAWAQRYGATTDSAAIKNDDFL